MTRSTVRRLLATVWQDLCFAARGFRRRPGFFALAALTLALGIGANTAMWSAVYAVLLAPLPFPDADRLVMVWLDNRQLGVATDVTSYPNYDEVRRQTRELTDLAAFERGWVNVTADAAEPERLQAAYVTASLFPTLGVAPAWGRGFVPAEDLAGGEPVVVLSHGLWRRRFGDAPAAAGARLRLDGTAYAVVGVMPPDCDFPAGTELWLPLALTEEQRHQRDRLWLHQVGRLRPGSSLRAVRAEMDALAARLVQEHDLPGYGLFVQPLRDHLVGEVRTPLLVLLAAVGCVLLIGCVNVVHLLLARAAARQREMVLRSALGAGRGRLIRQLVTETSALALVGGALGVAVAWAAVRALHRFSPAAWTRAGELALDGRALLFTLGLALLAGALVGVFPAVQATRRTLAQALKEGGRGGAGGPGRRRGRHALVATEVALTVVLLIGASLLIRSFERLLRTDPGFRTRGVLLVDLALPEPGYADPGAIYRFYAQLLERVAAVPGVAEAGASSAVLLPQLARSTFVSIEGQPDPPPAERIEVPLDAVTPDFFRALGIPLLAGRGFTAADHGGVEPVAIVDAAMARRFWGGESAVGKRFKYGDQDSPAPWRTVVGVVADARRTSLTQAARPSTFLPFSQVPLRRMTLAIHSDRPAQLLVPAVREAVWSLDPDLPLAGVATIETVLAAQLSERRVTAWILGAFAAAALVLALVGVYGVVSHTVSEATREIGVRMAVGADGGRVVRWVLRQGLAPVVVGLAAGLLAALLLTRVIAGLLFAVGALDPLTFAGAPLLLLAVAALASYLPARRAARISPLEVLRYD